MFLELPVREQRRLAGKSAVSLGITLWIQTIISGFPQTPNTYRQHQDFLEWARAYDTGSVEIRSKARHDAWQKILPCEVLLLDGADNLEDNFLKIKNYLQECENEGK